MTKLLATSVLLAACLIAISTVYLNDPDPGVSPESEFAYRTGFDLSLLPTSGLSHGIRKTRGCSGMPEAAMGYEQGLLPRIDLADCPTGIVVLRLNGWDVVLDEMSVRQLHRLLNEVVWLGPVCEGCGDDIEGSHWCEMCESDDD